MTDTPLAYRLALDGTVLIEASAGTGKTYTLVRLMARHILWHGHGIEQVLAVTFTNAAAAELKQRLRAFLLQVDAELECFGKTGRFRAENDIAHLFDGVDDAAMTQAVMRLKTALANIDRAAVFTIHGFCQRLLQRFALRTGQPIPAPALLEDESMLRLQVCEEFWRHESADMATARLLDAVFGNPEAMAGSLPHLLSHARLTPAPREAAAPDFERALSALHARHATDAGASEALLLAAFDDDTLNRTGFRSRESIHAAFAEIAAYLGDPDPYAPPAFGKLAFGAIKVKKGRAQPDTPLLRALEDWNAFAAACEASRRQTAIALHHRLADFARRRLPELKRQAGVTGFDDIIDTVYTALEADEDGSLAAEIRAAWPVALVDEFQDTDSRQWRIFERVYRRGEPAPLTLIGDPKQAIYGFRGGDIHTYLAAKALAGRHAGLEENFRSNPALLDGIARVFTGRRPHPFMEDGVAFTPVRAGRPGATLHLHGEPVPALRLLRLPADAEGKPLAVGAARLAAADRCADVIAGLLYAARGGAAQVAAGDSRRALTEADIAVLVHTNREAAMMQSRLRARGIDSVCVRRDSVFESHAAHDVLGLLHYLLQPGSHRAERTASAGLLLSAARAAGHAPDVPELAARLLAQGPWAAIAPILEAATPVLSRDADGQRHLGQYAQVLEAVQARYRPTPEPTHYLDWLGRRIALAGTADSEGAAPPRLESSQPRVRIMTLHQSKGLEFGAVFLPFSAIGRKPSKRFARYVEDGTRCLAIDLDGADAAVDAAVAREQQAESLRLLYVGMTRAKFALHCVLGDIKGFADSALGHLLLGEPPVPLDEALAGYAVIDAVPPAPALPVAAHVAGTPALPATVRMPEPWQVYSFSGLHREREADFAHAADDERPAYGDADPGPYQGAAFGNALHAVLENARSGDWRTPGTAAVAQCREALSAFGFETDAARAGAPALMRLAQATLHARLPEDVALIDLPAHDMRHEMEFHLSLRQAGGEEILALLHRSGYCRERTRLGFQPRLNGLLTGKIDLLYRHGGKLFVLDYKSNRLPDYGVDGMQRAIRAQEYDLQYLLYTVAVHRWLRRRLPDYRYERHFGGVRYLFARGLDPERPGNGIFRDRPDAGLIKALDACFDAEATSDA